MVTVEEIREEIERFHGFTPPTEIIEDYMKEHNEEFFDTLERENFMEYLAQKLIQMSWPMNADSSEYKRIFFTRLNKALNE